MKLLPSFFISRRLHRDPLMEVSCVFGREFYCAGGILVACVKITSSSSSRDSVLLAQASGCICADPKWVKSNDGSSVSFVNTPEVPLDRSASMPSTNAANTHSIFLTTREVLSTTQMTKDGVFLMFSLPKDLIPTYKGLSGTVTYSVTLTNQYQGGNITQIKYPFTVLGVGSTAIPYTIKVSYLSIFGASSIPVENSLLPQLISDSDDEEAAFQSPSSVPLVSINGVRYNIRDKEFICSLSMINDGDYLHPGSLLTIALHFEGCLQPCRSVRACVQQCENRIDGSRVQEKIIVEAKRSTCGAEIVYLRLHLPDSMPCTFISPLFQVSHHIVLEFFLNVHADSPTVISLQSPFMLRNQKSINDESAASQNPEPFTWNLPINIIPPRCNIDVAAEVNACFDPAAEFVKCFSLLRTSSGEYIPPSL